MPVGLMLTAQDSLNNEVVTLFLIDDRGWHYQDWLLKIPARA
jgi:hypothetical protein